MHNKIKWLLLGLVVVIAGAAITLTTGRQVHKASDASPSQFAAAVSTNQVAIVDYMFMPMTIKVKVGTSVTWTNKDEVHHSVTADQASVDAPSSQLFGQGQNYSFTFAKAGTYTFHCMPHPYMHGTVIVTQ